MLVLSANSECLFLHSEFLIWNFKKEEGKMWLFKNVINVAYKWPKWTWGLPVLSGKCHNTNNCSACCLLTPKTIQDRALRLKVSLWKKSLIVTDKPTEKSSKQACTPSVASVPTTQPKLTEQSSVSQRAASEPPTKKAKKKSRHTAPKFPARPTLRQHWALKSSDQSPSAQHQLLSYSYRRSSL